MLISEIGGVSRSLGGLGGRERGLGLSETDSDTNTWHVAMGIHPPVQAKQGIAYLDTHPHLSPVGDVQKLKEFLTRELNGIRVARGGTLPMIREIPVAGTSGSILVPEEGFSAAQISSIEDACRAGYDSVMGIINTCRGSGSGRNASPAAVARAQAVTAGVGAAEVEITSAAVTLGSVYNLIETIQRTEGDNLEYTSSLLTAIGEVCDNLSSIAVLGETIGIILYVVKLLCDLVAWVLSAWRHLFYSAEEAGWKYTWGSRSEHFILRDRLRIIAQCEEVALTETAIANIRTTEDMDRQDKIRGWLEAVSLSPAARGKLRENAVAVCQALGGEAEMFRAQIEVRSWLAYAGLSEDKLNIAAAWMEDAARVTEVRDHTEFLNTAGQRNVHYRGQGEAKPFSRGSVAFYKRYRGGFDPSTQLTPFRLSEMSRIKTWLRAQLIRAAAGQEILGGGLAGTQIRIRSDQNQLKLALTVMGYNCLAVPGLGSRQVGEEIREKYVTVIVRGQPWGAVCLRPGEASPTIETYVPRGTTAKVLGDFIPKVEVSSEVFDSIRFAAENQRRREAGLRPLVAPDFGPVVGAYSDVIIREGGSGPHTFSGLGGLRSAFGDASTTTGNDEIQSAAFKGALTDAINARLDSASQTGATNALLVGGVVLLVGVGGYFLWKKYR